MGEPSTMPGREDDPDAPWRRGFDGWTAVEARAEPSTVAPRRQSPDAGHPAATPDVRSVSAGGAEPGSTSRRKVVVGALAVAVLGVAAAVAVAVFRSTTPRLARTAPLVAEAADPVWVRAVDGEVDDVGVGVDVVVVAAAGVLESIDAVSGESRWAVRVDGTVDRVTVIDGQVVVELLTVHRRSQVVVFDGATGDELWSSADAPGVVSVSGGDDDALLFRRTQVDGDAVLEVLDPTTGLAVGEPLTLSGVTASGADLAVAPTDRTVAVWSRAERALVTGQVGSFNLRMAAPFEGRVVSLDREGRLILFDADGRRVDETQAAVASTDGSAGPALLAGVVPGEPIALVSAGSTTGFSIADDSIEVRWQRAGTTGPPVSTADGPYAVLDGPLDTTDIRTMVIDPVTGDTVAVTDSAGSPERPPILGHNAFVLAPTIGASERVLAAYDYDGDELWSTVLPRGAAYEVAHGVVVVVESSADGSRVSLAR